MDPNTMKEQIEAEIESVSAEIKRLRTHVGDLHVKLRTVNLLIKEEQHAKHAQQKLALMQEYVMNDGHITCTSCKELFAPMRVAKTGDINSYMGDNGPICSPCYEQEDQ